MPRRNKTVRLSAGEMELMSLLWDVGPVSITTAHQRFGDYGEPVSYPTMQTRLNRLVEKKLARKSTGRPALYAAVVEPGQVMAGHLDQLLDKLTGRSVAPLVSHLISERPLTAEEIIELKRLLAEAERTMSPLPPGED